MCLHEYTPKSTVTLVQLTVPEQGWCILDRPVFAHNLEFYLQKSWSECDGQFNLNLTQARVTPTRLGCRQACRLNFLINN